jgi:PIN domain nuclease of toxin-antitoxin system
MKLLMDSHTFLWFYGERHKLSSRALKELLDISNQAFLSLASVWELQIKMQKGKLIFNDSLAEVIEQQQARNGIRILPIHLSHILELENIPPHHKDPFDRLLISQAIVEGMTLVSADEECRRYNVEILW